MHRRPRVAHGNGLGHKIAAHHHRVAINRGRGPVEFLVFTGDSEALEFLAVLEGQSLPNVREADADLPALDGVRFVERAFSSFARSVRSFAASGNFSAHIPATRAP